MSNQQPAVEAAMPETAVSDFLRQPAAYAEHTDAVSIRETHISQVFLTDQHAYKLKKPVQFDFLDFSSPAKRQRACEEELRLNRRLAPDIYLDVLPVNRDGSNRLSLNGQGETIDWVVKMDRLPGECSLKSKITTGNVLDIEVENICDRLFDFYSQQPPVSISSNRYRADIDSHVRSNCDALLKDRSLKDDLIKSVTTAQLRFLHTQVELLDQRIQWGCVIEGHGDLRPEHIYLLPEPVIIDCIEFNHSYRCIDFLDELCFLAMECEHLGASSIGDALLSNYTSSTGDNPPGTLSAFYKTYRACVRAKVSSLRGRQLPDPDGARFEDEAQEYLAQANRTAGDFGKPAVIVIRGASGTGKSTLAKAIADLLAAEVVQTDAVRIGLFGASSTLAGYNEGRYSEGNRDLVYQIAVGRIEGYLLRGLTVIADGTYIGQGQQQAVANAAKNAGADLLFVNCSCPADIAAERIEKRFTDGDRDSDAQPATHLQQLQIEERPAGEHPQCDVDTTLPLDTQVQVVLSSLRQFVRK